MMASGSPMRRTRLAALISLLALPALAVAGSAGEPQALELQLLATGLAQPTAIASAGDGSGRLFIAEQDGTIRIWDGTQLLPADFLDIRTSVEGGGERGLLGLAFHPSYASNGLFYVHYSSAAEGGDATVAQYSVSAGDPNDANEGSGAVLLVVDQDASQANHNGGDMHFGPDGFLYVALGDDGGSGDPLGNGQDLSTLPGSLIRIDVDNPDPPLAYGIPTTNPFTTTPGARGEIWAYGLRNPWRFSFDRATGDVFIADVGQNSLEEVNLQRADSLGGENYGWNCKEGTADFDFVPACASKTLTDPIVEYAQLAGGCFSGGSGSVTGGYRYRGTTWKSLGGLYIYADFCTGQIYQAEEDVDTEWTATPALATSLSITTFGEDDDGELYLADRDGDFYSLPEPRGVTLALAALATLATLSLVARRARGRAPSMAASERVTSAT